MTSLYFTSLKLTYTTNCTKIILMNQILQKITRFRGVAEDLSNLRDRGPGFKTGPLTFTKANTNFRTLHVVGFSCTNEFYRIPSCKRR